MLRAVVLVPVVLLLALAAPEAASAEADPGGGGGGGGPSPIVSNTLTVTKTAGTVTSATAGIDCGSDCTHTDTQSDPVDPNAWDTLTLTATRGGGWAPSWTGCDGVNGGGQCVVKVDADRTVSLSWIDVQNPSVALDEPDDGDLVGPAMPVVISASDNAALASVQLLVDGVPRSYGGGVADMSSFGHGSVHTVAARATDTSGRTTTTPAIGVTVDKQVALTLGTPPAFVRGATVPLAIATDGDATMTCRVVGGAPAAACAGPTWSGITPATPDGTYTYEVVATDARGNEATGTRTFTLDRTAPAIDAFDGPPEGGEVTTDAVTFSFAASDANLDTIRCRVGAGAPGPCTTATTHRLTGLPRGATVTFTLIARDEAGNEVTRTRTFSVRAAATQGTGGSSTSTGAGAGGIVAAPAGPLGAGASQSGTGRGAPPAAAALEPNPAKLSYRRQRRRGRTRLVGLALRSVPGSATIVVTCRGGRRRGCPRRALRLQRRSGTVKLGRLARLRFRKGAVLTIRVSAPGTEPRTLTLRI